MRHDTPRVGISLAFVCLFILGAMPIIANSRPAGFGALSFAFCLSAWQLLCSLPLLLREARGGGRGIFGAGLAADLRRRTVVIILATGAIFALSTYVYVLAVEKAGAVSAAIAIQAYPLFAILLETVVLKRRKSAAEVLCVLVLVTALYFLATGGTWRIAGFSGWFVLALAIPFLWSIAHVIVKEVLDRTPITPAQVTFLRVLVSALALGIAAVAVDGPRSVARDLVNRDFQAFALVMGLVYYLELIFWFHAVRHIAVSMASAITVPAPALTMVLAIAFLGDRVAGYQAGALAVVAASIYGLILAGAKRRCGPAGPGQEARAADAPAP
ncbi:MAG: DMT family transporter [Rhodospirillaceae bacterium]|nr:DMT family transporter [Rhodospirillaceae bacterium]